MNIVDFWDKQVAKWDAEEKCGLCWEFGAPLIESAVNVQQSTEGKECCVKVLLLRDKITAFSTSNNYNSSTGFVNQQTCTKGFQLLVLLPSDIGTNNYNEITGHSEAQSKWTTILHKIEECLSCDANLDFCTFLGAQQRITTWSANQVINYSSHNYSGYRLTVNFQVVR